MARVSWQTQNLHAWPFSLLPCSVIVVESLSLSLSTSAGKFKRISRKVNVHNGSPNVGPVGSMDIVRDCLNLN